MKPIVSVLLPSRGRPDLLRNSIASLGKGNFEVLIRYDDDDKTMPLKTAKKNIKQIKGLRVGYANFHLMVNELAEQANGDWLLLWNDDAVMKTTNWVDIISKFDSKNPRVLNFFDTEDNQKNLFPVMSRAMYEAIGHFSLSTHCDTWALDIANGTGTHVKVDGIEAEHLRDSLDDATRHDTQAVYATSSPQYFSKEMRLLRDADMVKVREANHGVR